MSYVPPKAESCGEAEYAKMLSDTTLSLMELMEESDKLVLMDDLNCKEICWEELTTEGGESSYCLT